MLAHKKEDVEKRNAHLMGMALVTILVIVLIAAPSMFFMMAGYDANTGCSTKDSGNCLSKDDPIDKMVLDNTPKGLLYYSMAVAVIGMMILAYKGFLA